tara:strand:- start:51 stop:776 length:726 start_codon:yes stop_codon:yes gene_type:complete
MMEKEIKKTEVEKDLETLQKEEKELEKVSNKAFVIGIVCIVLALGFLFSWQFFLKEQPQTVDDLHTLNLDGKLDDEVGATYNGFSFVYANGLWNTEATSNDGSTLFNVYFHYLPTHVAGIPVIGELNGSVFGNAEEVYVTFDPIGADLQYVAVAVGKFDQTLIKAMGKIPVAACDKNETAACIDRPIVTCSSTDKATLSVEQMGTPKVIFEGNCIRVQGVGDGLVQAMERLLYILYGIMER